MIESLTEPAPVRTEHDTEPMAAVRANSPELCGVEGCWRAASPLVYCQVCKRPLCRAHTDFDVENGASRVICPEHAKGAS